MIAHHDASLLSWARAAVGAAVEMGAPLAPPSPGGSAAPAVLRLHLLNVLDDPLPGPAPRVHRARLEYLATATASDAAVAHDTLGALLGAAWRDESVEVALRAVPAELWLAFGVPPQPAVTFRVPLVMAVDDPPAPPVRTPLVVSGSAMSAMVGHVLGPGDQPVMGARVEAIGTERAATTDHRGAFELVGLRPGSRQLRVSARGRAFIVRTDEGTEPVVVRLDPTKE